MQTLRNGLCCFLALLGLWLSCAVAQAEQTQVARAPEVRARDGKPSCELKASRGAVLTQGQPVKIRWEVHNVTSATMDRFSTAIALEGRDAFIEDRPSGTTTYRMVVAGPGGSSSCRVSVVVPERTEPVHWPPPALSGMPAEYLTRARMALAAGITGAAGRPMSEQRWVGYATSSMLFGQDLAAVNAYFANDWEIPQHPEFGFGLFTMDSIRLYGLFNGRSGTMPNRLTAGAQRNIEAQFHKVASQTRFNDYRFAADAGNVWKIRGSENHAFAAQTSFLLASQFLKNSPEFATRPYEDGRMPGEHYEVWRRFFSVLLDERAKRGIYVEVGSPYYEDETRQAIQNIRDFSEDPILRRKAEMLLDLSYAIIAQESLKAVRGGAKSRVYSFRDGAWEGGEDRDYNLIFGRPDYVPKPSPQASSTYFPPSVVLNLAANEASRDVYEMAQRVPGIGVKVSKATPTILESDRSVFRYGFATPAYVLGSFVLDPAASYVPTSSQNRWQGVIFRGDPRARIAPQVTRLDRRGGLDSEQRVHDGFASLQDRNVLITQRSNYQTGYMARTDIYFSSTLDFLEEEGGWIFVRESDSFAAVRVVAQSPKAYEWIDPERKYRNEDKKKNFITLASPDSPIIIVTNQSSDYGGDFKRFKDAIRAQPLQQNGGVLKFATLDFYGPQRIGMRNGATVDISPPRLYDSPFIRSDWASGIVLIRKGDEVVRLDFTNPDNPTKSFGGGNLAGFPEGIGKAQPIVFGPR